MGRFNVKSKIILFLNFSIFTFLIFHNNINSQRNLPGFERCLTMDRMELRLQKDAVYRKFRQKALSIPKVNDNRKISCDGSNSIVVPVAFHFDEGFDCADLNCIMIEVQDQMDALNDAFGNNIASSSTMVSACPSAYQDGSGNSVVSTGTCIIFDYAQPPMGNSQGLQPCDLPITIDEFNGGLNGGGSGAGSEWAGIMNIFITNNQCLGIADGIPGSANGDGVTVCAEAFGGFDGPSSPCGIGLDDSGTFDRGYTLVHEIGHYLGLYHTFQGGCSDGDTNAPGPFNVDDTPPASSSFGGCNTSSCVNSGCSGGVQAIANFMDYTDDACMTMFTEDQAQVMNYWANQLFGSYSGGFAVGATTASCGSSINYCGPPVADFIPSAGNLNVCPGDPISFEDQTINKAASWSWSFTGTSNPSPTTSTIENPVITPANSGTLIATLTATNPLGINTTTKNYNVMIYSACNQTCTSFVSTDTPITISTTGNVTYTSTINVTGLTGSIVDVNIKSLDITHTYISDLDISIASPASSSINLMSDLCGGNNNVDIGFDDASTSSIPCPPVGNGLHMPDGNLSDFNGETPNGNWILTVVDDANQDGGTWNSWKIEICTITPVMNSCSINSVPYTTICNDNGTSIVSDDYFNFTIDPMVSGLSSTYSVTGAVTQTGVPYGSPTSFNNGGSGYLISGGNLSLTITDDVDPSCILNLTIISPNHCSTGPCPNTLTLSGVLDPAISVPSSSTIDYEVNDWISSSQMINPMMTHVDYDAANYILLTSGFSVEAGTVFHAFIDGCGGLLREEGDTQVKK